MTAHDEVLAEEIDWLRSFGWADERIADRFHIKLETFHTLLRRRRQRSELKEGK